MLHEKAEKRSSKDCLQPLNVHNLRIPSPCPLPAPSHACFGINLLGEGGSFAGGGGRPPPPASIFPSPASGCQVKSETSRWGGESKGWGLQLATMT